jgi:hypothetical protein
MALLKESQQKKEAVAPAKTTPEKPTEKPIGSAIPRMVAPAINISR